jgi:hypothetical protein
MADFVLMRRPAKMWAVEIDGTEYKIPLGGSMTHDEAAGLETPAGTDAFFVRYIPENVYGSLTLDERNALVYAWRKATTEAGTNLGE